MAFPDQIDVTSRTDRLKVAFTVFVARLIVDADGIVDFGELKLLSQAFPDSLLMQLGYLDASGEFTSAYREAYAQAARELIALPLAERLELITVFHRTSMADGELIQAELLVMREAAEIIGVSTLTMSEHLDKLKLKSISTRR